MSSMSSSISTGSHNAVVVPEVQATTIISEEPEKRCFSPFHEIHPPPLKLIFEYLAASDHGALAFACVNRHLYYQALHGVSLDSLNKTLKGYQDEAGKIGEENRALIYASLVSIREHKYTFGLEISRAVIEKLEGYFEKKLQILPAEFHDIMGREFIFARHKPIDGMDKRAEAQQYLDYAVYILTALHLSKFRSGDAAQNLNALLCFKLVGVNHENLKERFKNRKEAVQKIRSAELAKLPALDLVNIGLRNFLPHIGQLSRLRNLDLSNNWLRNLPSEIGKLESLTELDLRENELVSLPQAISQLSRLKKLYLRRNKLVSLPPEIGQLEKLETLILYSSPLSFLPQELGQLSSLIELDLSRNNLVSLPPEIGQLSSLIELDLSNNKLVSLPSEVGQLKRLVTLKLDRNSISILPNEVGQLGSLTKLDLSDNMLVSLPVDFWNLVNLCELKLFRNQLLSISANVRKLTNLVELELSNNELTTIPAEIREVSGLRWLNFDNNPITFLPRALYQMPHLGIRSLPMTGLGWVDCLRYIYWGRLYGSSEPSMV